MEKMYKYINEIINKMTAEQLAFFAWLCGVRAMPFLCSERKFTYWGKEKCIHLHSVFYALDMCAAIFTTAGMPSDTGLTYAVNASDRAVTNVRIPPAVRSATQAINYIACVADCLSYKNKGLANKRALDVANFVIESADRINPSLCIQITEVIASDLKAIMLNDLSILNHDTSIYGSIWQHFLEDLNSENCEYWSELYNDFFNCGFILDADYVKLRLSIPDEYIAQGAVIIGRYLDFLKNEEIEKLNESRIIILGEKGAGKTSLARRLIDIEAPMPEKYESTEGIDTKIWQLPDGVDKKIWQLSEEGGKSSTNVHIWDFAGHSITHSAHRFFMSARCLYIYVYNGRIENDNSPRYWLEQIKMYGTDKQTSSPTLFLVNREDDHWVEVEKRSLKKEYPFIIGFYDLNIAKDREKLEDFRQRVMNLVINEPMWNKQIMSSYGYKIKKELREYFESKRVPHITRDDFKKIADKCGVPRNKQEWILNELSTLGICLWYNKDDLDNFNTLVLNPDWIIRGIYKIINSGREEMGKYKRRHILSIKDGAEILKNVERYVYPDDKVEFLFRLMRLYDLAYFKSSDVICVPGILQVDQPEELPIFNSFESLTINFEVDKVLPPNIVSRLIVHRSDYGEIYNEHLLWRKGAVLKYEKNTFAIVREDGRRIIVEVKGEKRTEYISSLRHTLQEIFDNYQGITRDLIYKVLISDDLRRELHNEVTLEEKQLMAHLKNNIPHLESSTGNFIDLAFTGKEYNIYLVGRDLNIKNYIQENNKTEYHFEFNNSIIELKENLNNIAEGLRKTANIDDAEYIEEIMEDFEDIEEASKNVSLTELQNKLSCKKSLIRRIRIFADSLKDKGSKLHKVLGKVGNEGEMLMKLLSFYNIVASFVPNLLPQLPDNLLK